MNAQMTALFEMLGLRREIRQNIARVDQAGETRDKGTGRSESTFNYRQQLRLQIFGPASQGEDIPGMFSCGPFYYIGSAGRISLSTILSAPSALNQRGCTLGVI